MPPADPVVDRLAPLRPVLPWLSAGLLIGVAAAPLLLAAGVGWLGWLALPLVLWPAVWRLRHVLVALVAGAAGVSLAPQMTTAATPQIVSSSGEVVRHYPSRYRQSVGLVLDDPLPDGRRRLLIRLPVLPPVVLGDHLAWRGSLVTEHWDGEPVLVGRAVVHEVLRYREDGPQAWAWAAIERLPTQRPLAATLLLGRGRPPERDRFRRAGLLHLLAVSGLHLALATLGAAWLLQAVGLPWLWRQGLVALTAVAYLWLTGAAVPTQRALVMVLAWQLAGLLGRRVHGLTAWSLAALVLVLLHPGSVARPGFQLTLAAVGGIVTLGRDLIRWRERRWPLEPWPLDRPVWVAVLWLTRQAADGLAVGCAASLAVVPIIAWHFGEVQPYSAIASVLVAPVLVCALLGGLAWLVLQWLWWSGPWDGLGWLVDRSLAALAGGADAIAAWPGASFTSRPPPLWVLLLWPLLFLPCRDGTTLVLRLAAVATVLGGWALAVG